ncbi:cytotoxic and regulatory T-cell molecule [Arapaima gigas]
MSWRHIMCEATQREELPLTVRQRLTAAVMMALKLRLCFLICLCTGIAESSTVQNLTVIEGQTLVLNCSVDNTTMNHLEWKNPHEFLIFFNSLKVLKDQRYKMISFSSSEFTISLSNVKFKDGGFYKCLEYSYSVTTKMFHVTVVGRPRLEITEHEDKSAIKCSAQANFLPPIISWQFENGLEVYAQPQYHCDPDKCTSLDILLVRSHKRRVIVKCIIHHRALYSLPLMNFITVRNDTIEEPLTASTPGSLPSTSTFTSTHLYTESTTGLEFINNNETSSLGTTESALTNASLSTNTSTNTEGKLKERRALPSSRLLILLVSCLILALLVVVVFFAIKLRRAHILWKKENEDTDQSLESSKSKSSQEEKQAQERRGHGSVIKPGFHNTIFTKYRREDSVDKDAATAQNGHSIPRIQVTVETHEPGTSSQVKETEL